MSDNKSAEETKTENVYNNRLINNFITEINHAYYLQLQSGKSSNDTYTEQMDHERYRILSRLLKYTCTNDFILTEERINTEIDLFIHNTIQNSNNPNTFMDYSRAIEETTYTRPEFVPDCVGNTIFVGFNSQILPVIENAVVVSVDPNYRTTTQYRNVHYINKALDVSLLTCVATVFGNIFQQIVFDWSVWKFFPIRSYESILLSMFRVLKVGGYILLNKKEFYGGQWWGMRNVIYGTDILSTSLPNILETFNDSIVPLDDMFVVYNNKYEMRILSHAEWPQQLQTMYYANKRYAGERWQLFLREHNIQLSDISYGDTVYIRLKKV